MDYPKKMRILITFVVVFQKKLTGFCRIDWRSLLWFLGDDILQAVKMIFERLQRDTTTTTTKRFEAIFPTIVRVSLLLPMT